MPVIIIEVPDEIANRLADTGITPEEARRYALHRLGLLVEEKQALIAHTIEREEFYNEFGESMEDDDEQSPEKQTAENLVATIQRKSVLRTLINRICDRPMMYTGNGKFSKAVDFINGYDWGFRSAKETPPPDILGAFSRWLAGTYWKSHRFPRNVGWGACIEHFGADDAERFQLLRESFEGFLQRENVDSTPKP